jgi:hypothetical protein
MSSSAIKAIAEQVVILCVKFSAPPIVPQNIIEAHRNAPWMSLSLATLYLSFAKYWLAFLPVEEVWTTLGRYIDDIFFEFVEAARFEVRISDVILFSEERVAVCHRWRMSPEEFLKTDSDSDSLLGLVFADRSNQYTEDLQRGIVRQLEGQKSALGPLIYVYKRFNQHMYGIKCDVGTIDLDASLQHLCPFDMMFMDAFEALTAVVQGSASVLPNSL